MPWVIVATLIFIVLLLGLLMTREQEFRRWSGRGKPPGVMPDRNLHEPEPPTDLG